jgi:hypothetical protein
MIKCTYKFTLELQFILSCLNQYFIDHDDASTVMPAKAGMQAKKQANSLDASFRWHDRFNWDLMIQLVYRHKVTPFIYHVLKKHALTFVPLEILKNLQSHCVANTYKSLHLSAELIRITNLFKAEDISTIVLKGQPLANKLYGDPTLRESSDIDILIPIEKLNKAHRLMQLQGYECLLFPSTPKQMNFYLKNRKDFTYFNPTSNITIEIHWRWFNNAKFFELSLNDIWDTGENVTLGESTLKTLSSENEFLYLLAHASGHSWKYLFWLCDIRQILQSNPNFDWSNLINRANHLGVKRSLIEGVCLSYLLFNTPLPNLIQEAARQDKRTSFLIKTSLSMINRVSDPIFPIQQILSFRDFLLNPNWRYRIILLKELFGMIPTDWKLLKLNDKLFFLYHLLRPYSWLRRKMSLE